MLQFLVEQSGPAGDLVKVVFVPVSCGSLNTSNRAWVPDFNEVTQASWTALNAAGAVIQTEALMPSGDPVQGSTTVTLQAIHEIFKLGPGTQYS